MRTKNIKADQVFLLISLLIILIGIMTNKISLFNLGQSVSQGQKANKQETRSLPEEFRYTQEDGAIIIQSYEGEADTIIIPPKLEGLPVVGLETRTFDNPKSQGIKNIVIPEYIEAIGENTFTFCKNLEKLDVVAKNKYFKGIDGVLFNKEKTILIAYPINKSNVHYEIPAGVKIISEGAFSECKIFKTITFPKELILIEEKAFKGCHNLRNITLLEGLTTLESSAFENCITLQEIHLPSTLAQIDDRVFYECFRIANIEVAKENKILSSAQGALFDKAMTILYKYPTQKEAISYAVPESIKIIKEDAFGGVSNLEKVILSEGLDKIEERAFYGNEKLTSIELPKSLTYIGKHAFSYTGLTHVMIPKNVVQIENEALNYCEKLQSIEADAENITYKTINGVLFDKAETKLVAYPGGAKQTVYEIPNGVNTIGAYSFGSNKNLTSITIPPSVNIIEIGAFYSSNLEGIAVPKNVISIQNSAFQYCQHLTQVVIEDKLSEIGRSIFDNRGTLIIYGQEDDQLLKNYLVGTQITYISK